MRCVATFPQRKRRAPRRTSGEIHQQLLDAAGTLFEAQGYRATTTQQIVDKAGVDAATLYRHFESKADLFEATMLGPLKQFLDDHAAYWSSQPLGEVDPAELMRRYATGFFTMLHEHRDTMRLLVTASADDGVLGVIADRVSRQFMEGLVVMRNIVVAESEIHGYPGLQASDATIAGATKPRAASRAGARTSSAQSRSPSLSQRASGGSNPCFGRSTMERGTRR